MVKKKNIALGKGAAALFGNVNATAPLENERKLLKGNVVKKADEQTVKIKRVRNEIEDFISTLEKMEVEKNDSINNGVIRYYYVIF